MFSPQLDISFSLQDSWVARNGAEPRLPGLNYTPRQLFWVSFPHVTRTFLTHCLKVSAANVWCAKYRPKALKLRVLTGVHSPDQFRVQGPFSNMDDFSRDFNCPIGSNMNPPKENKCQVNFHVFCRSVQNIAGVVTR